MHVCFIASFFEQALSPHLAPTPDFQQQDYKELGISQVRTVHGFKYIMWALSLWKDKSTRVREVKSRAPQETFTRRKHADWLAGFLPDASPPPQIFILKVIKALEKLKEQFNE